MALQQTSPALSSGSSISFASWSSLWGGSSSRMLVLTAIFGIGQPGPSLEFAPDPAAGMACRSEVGGLVRARAPRVCHARADHRDGLSIDRGSVFTVCRQLMKPKFLAPGECGVGRTEVTAGPPNRRRRDACWPVPETSRRRSPSIAAVILV